MNKLSKSAHKFINDHLIDARDRFRNLDIFLSLLILLMLFIIPLLPASLGLGYEQIKVMTFLVITSIVSFVWIIASIQNPARFQIKKSLIHLMLGLFLVSLAVISFLGVNLYSSLFGNSPYYQGFIVYLYGYLVFLLVSTLPLKKSAIYYALTLSSLVVSLWALKDFFIQQLLGGEVPNYSGRVVSSFGQPNLFAGFLLLTLPFTIYLAKQSSSINKKVLYILLVVNILGIVVSDSRAALLLVLALLLSWCYLTFKGHLMRALVVLVILFTVGVGGYALYSGTGIVYQEIINPLTPGKVEGQERRLYIWAFVWDLIQKRPFTGYGLDNLREVFPQGLKDQNPKPAFYFTVKDLIVDRSHNYLLDLLVFSGAPGLSVWLGLLLVLGKYAAPPERLFLLVYFLWIQLQIQGIVHLVMFFVIAGIIQKNIQTKKEVL